MKVNALQGVFLMLLASGLVVSDALQAEVRHPLDALDASEIASAVALLRDAGHADDEALYVSISVGEPPKSEVLEWRPGKPIPRTAAITLRKDAKTYEGVVDLVAGEVRSFRQVPGAQPMVMFPEFMAAMQAATRDPRMKEGLAKRGITDLNQIFCAPRTVGNFGKREEETRRLVKVDCFDTRGVKTNVFATAIEGLFATVDLDTNEVITVTDSELVPIPPGNHDLDPESIGKMRQVRPVLFSSPRGSNLRIDGSTVAWQKWSFHVRWDPRMALVLSLVGIDGKNEGSERRSVLYQGTMAEIFVPYQDPTVGWYFRNYMDQGEYGLGATASRLERGCDCPASATFLSPVMSNAGGGADTLEDRVCIFERTTGDPLWRHYDFVTEALESRPALELVVRYIATVGNYDYAFDWIFDQGGRLTFRGGATGIDGVKGVRAQHLSDPTAKEDTEWGPLIAPGRAGINHDHFFSIRLDLDVDGVGNNFVREALVPETLPAASPRRSVWRIRSQVAKIDSAAKYRLRYDRPALWRVVNPHKKNALGYPVSYALRTSGNALPVVAPEDPPLSRAGFANYHLWVTPYRPGERFAAGRYPNQSQPGQGLPAWTSHQRDIEDEDLVLWYTLGFHHVPSAEDWPVYNLAWHSLTLRPYNFFDQNPALDVPPLERDSEATTGKR